MHDEMRLLLDASAVLSALYLTGGPLTPEQLAAEAKLPSERLVEAVTYLEALGRVVVEPSASEQTYPWTTVALP